MSRYPISLVLAVFAAGCGLSASYAGDGRLRDAGPFAATDRYVLTLGLVNLKQEAVQTYRIEALPEENFVVGLEINNRSGRHSTLKADLAGVAVAVSLKGRDGIVFDSALPLSKWTWALSTDDSPAFVYLRGDPGSFFRASPKAKYVLTLKVLTPDSSKADYSVTAVAKSGGWK